VLNLPDVTLVLIETREHDLAELALRDCEAVAEFGDVLVLTDRPAQFLRADRRVVTVDDWPNKMGWSRAFWYDVPLHVRTSHALCIQWDSWIVDPEMWRDEYLEWDFIGAPWWYNDGMNVGNGGFCLRSTKLMKFVRKHRDSFPVITDLDDDLYCRKYRPSLQAAGFEWAPEPIAQGFAFECVRPDKTARHFGFHAAYNFDYGCQNDEARIMERAVLMAKSKYICQSNGYIWKGFTKKLPWVQERLKVDANCGDFLLPEELAPLTVLPGELDRKSAEAAQAFANHEVPKQYGR
jgi:Protein of unknown function (DUF5672)